MRSAELRLWVLVFAVAIPLAGCGDDDSSADGDGGLPDAEADGGEDEATDDAPAEADAAEAEEAETDTGPVEPEPGPEFEAFCGTRAWDESLLPGTVNELAGTYSGVYDSLPAGAVEMMKVIPPHPFQVTRLRVAFGGGRGTARLRLMRTMGRSYPGDYPRMDGSPANLIEPAEIAVTSPDGEEWLEIDVEDQGVFLLPTEHYALVYEHLTAGPFLAVEDLPAGEASRALMIIPTEDTPYGVDGNYRLELEGRFFCSWTPVDRWFEEDVDAPFAAVASSRVAVSDLDGDGHDDLILNDGSPQAWLGDGAGAFAEPGFEPFPDVPAASMLVFADLDDDGDRDAFAATYVSMDADGDTATITDGGDCNDADAAIHPDAVEAPGNGKDDDCDGVVDDGAGTADADGDTVTTGAGDCDDARIDVAPGLPERLDTRDNDCDLSVDEEFVNRILLNDGTGLFTALPDSGVEALDPSAAAGFGDADGDGDLDLYWGNWLEHYPDPAAVHDRFVSGNGDGTFVEATVAASLRPRYAAACYGVEWSDFDNDGLQDIFVGNYGYGLNFLWHNLGGGLNFEEVGRARGVARDAIGADGGNTFGGDWGDIDNDGDLDLFEANIAHPRYQPWSDPSLLLVNGGAPDWSFTESRDALGLVWDEGDVNAAFADFDNDGWLDLAIASLYPQHYSRLYRNDGGTGFVDVTYQTGTAVQEAVSAAWSDVDEDGDLDLLIADRSGAPYVHLFVNRAGGENAWIELDLEGSDTNRDAVGARVALTAAGVTRIREVKGGGGHSNTQSTHVVHFGLGDAAAVERATVRWTGGDMETIGGLAPNHRYRVVEGSGVGVRVY